MANDPTELDDDDLTNIVRLHEAKTPSAERVEKSVFQSIQKLEQEKLSEEASFISKEKGREGNRVLPFEVFSGYHKLRVTSFSEVYLSSRIVI